MTWRDQQLTAYPRTYPDQQPLVIVGGQPADIPAGITLCRVTVGQHQYQLRLHPEEILPVLFAVTLTSIPGPAGRTAARQYRWRKAILEGDD